MTCTLRNAGCEVFVMIGCHAKRHASLRLLSNSMPNFGVVGAVDLTNRRCLTQSMVMSYDL